MSAAITHVDVGGARVEVRVIEPPHDAPSALRTQLVFLHEGLGSISLWRDFPDLVAAQTGLRTIVYSRRGYGGSDPIALPRPVSFMHDEAKGDLPRVLDAVGAREDVILVGHSDGASIALLYASSRPKGLRGVVAMAPHVFVEDVSIASITRARATYEETDLRARLEKHHGKNVDVAFRGWNDVWLSPAFRSWNIEEAVGSIEVPILVIQGREDEYGTLAQVEAIRARSDKAQALILERCGHSPHRDRKERTLEAIASFVGLATGTRGS